MFGSCRCKTFSNRHTYTSHRYIYNGMSSSVDRNHGSGGAPPREGIGIPMRIHFLECGRAFLFSHWSHSFGCVLRRTIVKRFHRQICPSGIQIGHRFFCRHFSPVRFSVATAAGPAIFDLFSQSPLKKIGFSVASIVFTCFASLATLFCRCLTTVKNKIKHCMKASISSHIDPSIDLFSNVSIYRPNWSIFILTYALVSVSHTGIYQQSLNTKLKHNILVCLGRLTFVLQVSRLQYKVNLKHETNRCNNWRATIWGPGHATEVVQDDAGRNVVMHVSK